MSSQENKNVEKNLPAEEPTLPSKDGEDYDPHLHREVDYALNDWEAVFTILKGCLGVSITVAPYMFRLCGIIISILMLCLVAIFLSWMTSLLIKTEYMLCKRYRMPYISFASSLKAAMRNGPPKLKPLSKFATCIANVVLIVYQLMIIVTYITFMAHRLEFFLSRYTHQKIVNRKTGDQGAEIPAEVIVILMLIPLILISLLKSLKFLIPFVVVAVLMIYFSYIFLISSMTDYMPCGKRKYFGNFLETMIACGSAVANIQCFGVVITVERNLKNPKHFCTTYGILNVSYFLAALTVCVYGTIGYWKFGEELTPVVLASFEKKDDLMSSIVTVSYVLATYLSYALQLHVGMDILWNIYLYPRLRVYRNIFIHELGIRCFVVIVLSFISMFIPHIEIVALIPLVFCSLALYILPALIYLYANWNDKNQKRLKWTYVKVSIVIVLGIVCTLSETMYALQDIILQLK